MYASALREMTIMPTITSGNAMNTPTKAFVIAITKLDIVNDIK